MYKGDYILIAMLCVMVFLLSVLVSMEWQKGCNNERELAKLREYAVEQKAENEKVRHEIDVLTRELARSGLYDKK